MDNIIQYSQSPDQNLNWSPQEYKLKVVPLEQIYLLEDSIKMVTGEIQGVGVNWNHS
jgi:hypothetical protein